MTDEHGFEALRVEATQRRADMERVDGELSDETARRIHFAATGSLVSMFDGDVRRAVLRQVESELDLSAAAARRGERRDEDAIVAEVDRRVAALGLPGPSAVPGETDFAVWDARVDAMAALVGRED
jgi:hypothetical protein